MKESILKILTRVKTWEGGWRTGGAGTPSEDAISCSFALWEAESRLKLCGGEGEEQQVNDRCRAEP